MIRELGSVRKQEVWLAAVTGGQVRDLPDNRLPPSAPGAEPFFLQPPGSSRYSPVGRATGQPAVVATGRATLSRASQVKRPEQGNAKKGGSTMCKTVVIVLMGLIALPLPRASAAGALTEESRRHVEYVRKTVLVEIQGKLRVVSIGINPDTGA